MRCPRLSHRTETKPEALLDQSNSNYWSHRFPSEAMQQVSGPPNGDWHLIGLDTLVTKGAQKM